MFWSRPKIDPFAEAISMSLEEFPDDWTIGELTLEHKCKTISLWRDGRGCYRPDIDFTPHHQEILWLAIRKRLAWEVL